MSNPVTHGPGLTIVNSGSDFYMIIKSGVKSSIVKNGLPDYQKIQWPRRLIFTPDYTKKIFLKKSQIFFKKGVDKWIFQAYNKGNPKGKK